MARDKRTPINFLVEKMTVGLFLFAVGDNLVRRCESDARICVFNCCRKSVGERRTWQSIDETGDVTRSHDAKRRRRELRQSSTRCHVTRRIPCWDLTAAECG